MLWQAAGRGLCALLFDFSTPPRPSQTDRHLRLCPGLRPARAIKLSQVLSIMPYSFAPAADYSMNHRPAGKGNRPRSFLSSKAASIFKVDTTPRDDDRWPWTSIVVVLSSQ